MFLGCLQLWRRREGRRANVTVQYFGRLQCQHCHTLFAPKVESYKTHHGSPLGHVKKSMIFSSYDLYFIINDNFLLEYNYWAQHIKFIKKFYGGKKSCIHMISMLHLKWAYNTCITFVCISRKFSSSSMMWRERNEMKKRTSDPL